MGFPFREKPIKAADCRFICAPGQPDREKIDIAEPKMDK